MSLRAIAALILLALSLQAGAGIDEAKGHFLAGQYDQAMTALGELDDAEAHFLRGLMHDAWFHTLPFYFGPRNNPPVYDGGIELSNEEMVRHYRPAIEAGHIGARFRYCIWSTSPYGNDNLKAKNSRCHRLYRELRKLASESDDPMLAYYAYVYGSGETGSKARHARAIDLLQQQADSGDSEAQFFLAKTLLQYNPRYDRPSDFVNAFGWLSAAAAQKNYHARVYQVFTADKLESEEDKQAAAQLAKQLMDKFAP